MPQPESGSGSGLEPLSIGALAQRTEVSAKTIRYYESIGLLPEPARASNGYRKYSERAVGELRFVHRARGLGFPLEDVARLLALWRDQNRRSTEVKALALTHVRAVERKIAELETIRDTLLDLANRCGGDHRPDCPILDELGQGSRES